MGASEAGPPVIWHGPYYFHQHQYEDALHPAFPENVGSPPVTHTGFWFTQPDEFGGVIVMLTGEHATPSEPVITEAQIQLYGAERVIT
jgi:hypothetical protein